MFFRNYVNRSLGHFISFPFFKVCKGRNQLFSHHLWSPLIDHAPCSSFLTIYKLSSRSILIFNVNLKEGNVLWCKKTCVIVVAYLSLPSCNQYRELLRCSKTLRAFRSGKVQVLISSDAMSRGMDVEGVRNVINYDMPAYIKTYIHWAGRTARAGLSGCCFTLMHKDEVKRFKKMLQKADCKACPTYSASSEVIESLRSVLVSFGET